MRYTSVDAVMNVLTDVDYPAHKDDLVRTAEAAGAATDVLKALRGLPVEYYRSREEVARSVPVHPASDLGYTPAQLNDQARTSGRGGQSQYAREVPKRPIEDELDE